MQHDYLIKLFEQVQPLNEGVTDYSKCEHAHIEQFLFTGELEVEVLHYLPDVFRLESLTCEYVLHDLKCKVNDECKHAVNVIYDVLQKNCCLSFVSFWGLLLADVNGVVYELARIILNIVFLLLREPQIRNDNLHEHLVAIWYKDASLEITLTRKQAYNIDTRFYNGVNVTVLNLLLEGTCTTSHWAQINKSVDHNWSKIVSGNYVVIGIWIYIFRFIFQEKCPDDLQARQNFRLYFIHYIIKFAVAA